MSSPPSLPRPPNPGDRPAGLVADASLIDSPLMRQAGREPLSLALMDSRNHTLHLFAQFQNALEDGRLAVAALATVNPPLWALGHVGWFQEWWVARNMQRALGQRADPSCVRLASIEPGADGWWNPLGAPAHARHLINLPDAAHCRAYLLETLESTLDLLGRVDDSPQSGSDDAFYFYRLCLFHEDMQCEALAVSAQALGLSLDKPLMGAFTPAPMALREPLRVPATVWQMGSARGPGEGFAFDNEMPPHGVSVPEFEIDAQPVSWSQFVEFVSDGAYDREALWHPDGWRWLQGLASGEGRRGPRYVDQIGVASGAVMQTRFGVPTRMQAMQPALHVSWWEADAWCRWAGRRLPAEVEWEAAAHTLARRGFRWGDVWEWTGTTFRGYPGFVPDPWREYSAPAFGSHKVLRGASFATRARMKNLRHRHFALPGDDSLFCGFRSCLL